MGFGCNDCLNNKWNSEWKPSHCPNMIIMESGSCENYEKIKVGDWVMGRKVVNSDFVNGRWLSRY